MQIYYPNWLDMFNMSKQKQFFLKGFRFRGRTLGIALKPPLFTFEPLSLRISLHVPVQVPRNMRYFTD